MTQIEKNNLFKAELTDLVLGFNPNFEKWFNKRYKKCNVPAESKLSMIAAWSGCNRLWKERIFKYINKIK